MATQSQNQSQNQPPDNNLIMCTYCPSKATHQCFVKGIMIGVCDNCNLMLNHTDRFSSLEAEFNQYQADQKNGIKK